MTGYDDLIRVTVVVWQHLASRNRVALGITSDQVFFLRSFCLLRYGRTRDEDNVLNSKKVWLYVNCGCTIAITKKNILKQCSLIDNSRLSPIF